MIVSVHIPKTAGSSFRQSLQKIFNSQVLLDYDNIWMPKNPVIRNFKQFVLNNPSFPPNKLIINSKYKVIHGHFYANKYKNISKEVKLITFFRDPIDRVVSNYLYIQKNPFFIQPTQLNNSMYQAVRNNQMNLKDFSELEAERNLYSNYLGGVGIDNFTFIGLTEAYEDSIKLFSKIFGIELDLLFINKGKGSSGGTKDYYSLIKDLGFYSDIVESQKENQLIYDQAKRKFEQLCNQYL
ncbi:MAG: sulfotransferase family 2 domain-containing protein [Cyanobacteriota bacterium]|nr:sulfotransferase family 2 domain-containing protein [Cyanobacteriota bacterium]